MESLLTAVPDYLAYQSWQVAVVFLLVAAACFGLRRASAHWRYLLWLVVLAKCLTPGFIRMPLAVLPHQAEVQETPERLSAPVAMAEPHEIHLPTAPAAAEPETATAAAPPVVAATETGPQEIAGTTDDAVEKASTVRNTDPRAWWAVAWCSGVAMFIAYALAKAWATNRKLRLTRLAADPRIAAKVAALAQRLGMKAVPAVYTVEAVAQPFVWGWLRGSIYVPRHFLTTGTNEQQEAILAHELAHVARWDAAANMVQIVVQALFFFHPLVWWTNRQIRRERENCCDETVIAGLGADPKQYGQAIVDTLVAEYEASQPAPSLAVTGRLKNVEERIETILSPNRRFFRRPSWMAVITVVLLAACAVPTALVLTVRGEPPASTRAKPGEESPEKPTVDAAKQAAGVAENTAAAMNNSKANNQPDAADTADIEAASAAPQRVQTLRVIVLDPQGKPLPDAEVHARFLTEEGRLVAERDCHTDTAGAAQLELPKTYSIVQLRAGKKPFVSMFAGWQSNELASGKRLPDEYRMQLESGVTAGGRIVDEEGRPIAGAKVEAILQGDAKPTKGDGRIRYDPRVAYDGDAVKTDAEGRWRVNNVPNNPKATLELLVYHPDYISDEYMGQAQKAAGITMDALRQETATITLKRGIILRGRVTDLAGQPVKDAVVVYGDYPFARSGASEFPSDAEGRFRLPALRPGERNVTVIAARFAPQLRRVNFQTGLPPQDFQMKPGKPIQLRFVDAAGRPVPDVGVHIAEWKGRETIEPIDSLNHPKLPDTGIPSEADAGGLWQWTSAPDEPVKLQASLKGYASVDLEIPGGAPPKTVVLKSEHRITGGVTDAVTRKPIPLFTVIPLDVFGKDWIVAERMNAKLGKDGRLNYLAWRIDYPLRLRIEAMGYRTQDGPQFRVGDDTSRTQDFRLTPSAPVVGAVVDAAGRPVAKAEVSLATPTEAARSPQDPARSNDKSLTDAAGRFRFADPGEPFAVVAQADAGFAQAKFPAGQHDAGTLQLQPWASVRGQFREDGQPVPQADTRLTAVRFFRRDRPSAGIDLNTQTDANGRFDFPRVPPVPVSVHVYLGPWRDTSFWSGPSVPLELRPGQRVELDLGGSGTTVKGKAVLTGKVPAGLDCVWSFNELISREPGIAPPREVAAAGLDVRKGWCNAWRKTAEGNAYLSTLRHWLVKLSPDGAFRISGVPPGEYDLAIQVYARPRESSGSLGDPLAQKVVPVTVTAADAARGELVLPEIAATVAPIPAIGDAPALRFERADGAGGSLADFRGRLTIVQFWATWCGACKQQFPALRQMRQRFADHNVAILSLSLDEDGAAWQAELKRLDLPWPQGRVAAGDGAGLPSVPAYWMLDSAGKIVAKADDPAELGESLDKTLK